MNKKKIIAVIVTYNRKEDLIECLNGVFNQSYPIDELFIIDNKSNDGTPQYLFEKKIIPKICPKGILAKICGSIINARFGPESGIRPNANTAGNIAKPANMLARLSPIATR